MSGDTRDPRIEDSKEAGVASLQVAAANEELAAMNEQLEAANEELIALNEELFSVNDQLLATRMELQKQKDFFEEVVNTAKAIIIGLDVDGSIRLFNAHAEKITGWSRQEVLGKDWLSNFVPGDYHPKVTRAFKKLLEQHNHDEIENPILTKNGEQRIIAWNNTIVNDSDGAITLVIGTGTDITERKKYEAVLKQLASIVEFSDDAIIGKNTEGVITSWNPGAERLYGYQAREVIGRSITFLVPEEQQDEIPLLLAKIKSGVSIDHYETVRLHKDGQQLVVSVTISPIRDDQGNIIGASTIARDITERKQAEELLRRLSYMDGLTGVSNRRHFDEILDKEWKRCMREDRYLSLIILDIDFFKAYNDTYGHLEGDRCLKDVADLLSRVVSRPGDLAARYGGEEFAVILPSTMPEGAVTVAERIRAGIEELRINHGGSSIGEYVTVSLGTASVIPKPEVDPKVVLQAADAALYKAKQGGRNRSVQTIL